MGMNGRAGMTAKNKQQTLIEYARAVKTGNTVLAKAIKNANGKDITSAEFSNAVKADL